MSKRTVTEVCRDIRNLMNKPIFIQNLRRHSFNWDLSCAAMDTIEDTELAIGSFSKEEPTSSQGKEYLRIYGLFQAMYMQQDAVRNLAEGLCLSSIDISTSLQASNVRETRNKYFGHPKYGRKKDTPTTYHGVSRITIGGPTITAWTYPNFSTEEINLRSAIEANEKYIRKSVEEILNGMKEKKLNYVATIRTTLNVDAQTYAFEKIYSWVYGNTADRAAMTDASLKIIRTAINDLESGLNERYENISGVGDTERTIKKSRYLLDTLDTLFADNPTGMNGDFNAEILVESLQNSFNELIEVCIEINSEFSSTPNRQSP